MKDGLAFTGLMAAVVVSAAAVNAVPAAHVGRHSVPNSPATNVVVPSNPAPVSQIQLPLPQPAEPPPVPVPPAESPTVPISPRQPTQVTPRPTSNPVPVQPTVQPPQSPQPPAPSPTQQPGNPCDVGLVLDPVLGVCVRI